MNIYLKKAIILAIIVVVLNVLAGIFYGVSKKMWSHKTTKNIDKGMIIGNSLTFIIVFTVVVWNIGMYIMKKY
jgi:hypothetical protein